MTVEEADSASEPEFEDEEDMCKSFVFGVAGPDPFDSSGL
jgi:hypothetical protein